MAVASSQVTVTTTATALPIGEGDGQWGLSISVYNGSAVNVFIGDATVTTTSGYPVAAGTSLSLDLGTGEALYAIVATGTAAVNVLRVGA